VLLGNYNKLIATQLVTCYVTLQNMNCKNMKTYYEEYSNQITINIVEKGGYKEKHAKFYLHAVRVYRELEA